MKRAPRKSSAPAPPPPREPSPADSDAMDVDEDPHVVVAPSPPRFTKPRRTEPARPVASSSAAASIDRRKTLSALLDPNKAPSSDEAGNESGFSLHNPFQRDSPDRASPPVQPRSRVASISAPRSERGPKVADLARAFEPPAHRSADTPSRGWNDPPSPPPQQPPSRPRSPQRPRQSAPIWPPPTQQPALSPFMRDPSSVSRARPSVGQPLTPEPTTEKRQLDPSPSPPPSAPELDEALVSRQLTVRKPLKVVATSGERAVAMASKSVPVVGKSVGALAMLFLLTWASWYRDQTVALGYCTPSGAPADLPVALPLRLPSNAAFDSLALQLPLPEPTCLPCPPHGVCEAGRLIRCAPDHLRRPSSFGLGVGGLGLVPTGETCVLDPLKEQREARLALDVLGRLRSVRGEIECAQLSAVPEDPFVLGLRVADLREELSARSKLPREVFDRTFDSAVRVHLEPYDQVRFATDAAGERYIVAKNGDLGVVCRTKKASYSFADQHKFEGFCASMG